MVGADIVFVLVVVVGVVAGVEKIVFFCGISEF